MTEQRYDPPKPKQAVVKLTAEETREFSCALADVLCWFRGFSAAHVLHDRQPELPPDLDGLRRLNIRLKNDLETATIPF